MKIKITKDAFIKIILEEMQQVLEADLRTFPKSPGLVPAGPLRTAQQLANHAHATKVGQRAASVAAGEAAARQSAARAGGAMQPGLRRIVDFGAKKAAGQAAEKKAAAEVVKLAAANGKSGAQAAAFWAGLKASFSVKANAAALTAAAASGGARGAAMVVFKIFTGPIGWALTVASLIPLVEKLLPTVSWWAGGVSQGKTDRVSAKYSGLAASNWLRWPLEAQCAFCKENGRKPKLSNGKLAPGPSCADMLANKGLCPDAPPPPPPLKKASLCSRNARLWKSMPDLGPNRKAATKTLQDYLKAAGYSKQMPRTFRDGKADGSCGKETIAAIKAFQRDNGLKVDGLYGNESHAKMKEILKGSGPSAVTIRRVSIQLDKNKNEYLAIATLTDGKQFSGRERRSGTDDTSDQNLAKAEARSKAMAYLASQSGVRESIKKELKKLLKEELLK